MYKDVSMRYTPSATTPCQSGYWVYCACRLPKQADQHAGGRESSEPRDHLQKALMIADRDHGGVATRPTPSGRGDQRPANSLDHPKTKSLGLYILTIRRPKLESPETVKWRVYRSAFAPLSSALAVSIGLITEGKRPPALFFPFGPTQA